MLNKVIEILAEKLDKDASEIQVTSKIKDDLGADSLDMVEIVMEIEEEFDVEVDDADTALIITVQDIIDYVTKKQA
ncbi:MAG: acyl carrier protein [Proteocatella sp.]